MLCTIVSVNLLAFPHLKGWSNPKRPDNPSIHCILDMVGRPADTLVTHLACFMPGWLRFASELAARTCKHISSNKDSEYKGSIKESENLMCSKAVSRIALCGTSGRYVVTRALLRSGEEVIGVGHQPKSH